MYSRHQELHVNTPEGGVTVGFDLRKQGQPAIAISVANSRIAILDSDQAELLGRELMRYASGYIEENRKRPK